MSTLDPLEWRDLTAEIFQCHSVTRTVLPGERPLNLTAECTVLTFQTATSPACPDSSSWQQAHLEELDRLHGATHTMHAIMPADQPFERRHDTTYYNP